MGVDMILIRHCVIVLGLLLGALAATPASAAKITYEFSVTPTTGHLDGKTYSGSFSFDSAALTGLGTREITPGNGGLSVTFTFDGTTYGTADAGGFPTFPEVTFRDGVLLGLSFAAASTFSLGSTASGYADGGVDFLYFGSAPFLSSNAVTYTLVTEESVQVPAPMTLALLGAGLVGLGLAHRRRSRG
jgi:hypothetical protein